MSGDGQYLFAEDVLGYTRGHRPRHAKVYRDFAAEYRRLQQERVAAFKECVADVEGGAIRGRNMSCRLPTTNSRPSWSSCQTVEERAHRRAEARKDYGLTSATGQAAIAASRYATPIPRQRTRELMRRKDGARPAGRVRAVPGALGTLLCPTGGSWPAVRSFGSRASSSTRPAARAGGTSAARYPPGS